MSCFNCGCCRHNCEGNNSGNNGNNENNRERCRREIREAYCRGFKDGCRACRRRVRDFDFDEAFDFDDDFEY